MTKKDKDNMPFPECYENCEVAEHLGVGECEAICPDKFDPNTGLPIRKE